MARAEVEGWHFGAKIVRGAYLVLERQRAAERGYQSPIFDTKAATDFSYDRCAGFLGHICMIAPQCNRNFPLILCAD